MNKKIYIPIQKQRFGQKVTHGISLCMEEAQIYAKCASSQGLGIEYKKCENEFQTLLSCMRTKAQA